jgi:hypothetical protein
VELCEHYLYSEGTELGPAALDIRAGQAPEELALGLCKLTRDCLEDRHQRRVGLTAVMRQLNLYVAQFCAPIVEEGLLSAAREEIECLRRVVHLGERECIEQREVAWSAWCAWTRVPRAGACAAAVARVGRVAVRRATSPARGVSTSKRVSQQRVWGCAWVYRAVGSAAARCTMSRR